MSTIFRILLCLFIGFPLFSEAQSHQIKKDDQSCFEWSFGANVTHYKLTTGTKYQLSTVPYDTFMSITNSSGLGFTGGILKNFMIGGRSIVRPGVKFAVYKGKINYTTWEDQTAKYNFDAIVIEAPLHWVQPINATPGYGPKHTYMYTIFGGTFVNEIEVNSESIRRKVHRQIHDITLDLGFGARFYANKKHLGAVEIKYAFGLLNLYEPGYDLYRGSLEKITRNTFSVAFNFS